MLNIKKIENIIEIIKNKINKNDDIKNIFEEIKKKLIIEFLQKEIKESDLYFLIKIVKNSMDEDNNKITMVFLNNIKTIEKNVLVYVSKIVSESNLDIIYVYINKILNIFKNYGWIYILPDNYTILYNNNKINKIEDSDLEERKGINIIYFNFNNFDKNISIDISRKFQNFTRIFYIYNNKGFELSYDLIINYKNDIFYTTYNDNYDGLADFVLNDKHKEFQINNKNDIIKIFEFFLSEIIKIFKNDHVFFIQMLKTLISFKLINNYLCYIIKNSQVIKKKFFINPIKKIKNFIYVFDDYVFIPEKELCKHDIFLNNIEIDENYFNKINEFINTFIDFINEECVCVFCNEIITRFLFITSDYITKKKYIFTSTSVDILNIPPYENFNNINAFFNEFYYNFDFFIFNLDFSKKNTAIKLSIDNFINFSNNRFELEKKYNNEIKNNEMFFLRLDNNFFIINEKEKFKKKKIFFMYIYLILNNCLFLNFNNVFEIFYIKKKIKLKKNSTILNYEDIIVLIIDYFFKKTAEEIEISFVKHKEFINYLKKIINIYKEISNEDFKYLYNNKKKNIDRLLKEIIDNKNIIIDFKNIENYLTKSTEFKKRNYILDFYYFKKSHNLYKKDYYDFLETILKNKDIVYDFINFDFDDIYDNFLEEELLNNLLKGYNNLIEYLYNEEIFFSCKINTDEYIFYNKDKLFIVDKDSILVEAYNINKDLKFYMINDYKTFIKDIDFQYFNYSFLKFSNYLEKKYNKKIIYKNIDKIKNFDIKTLFISKIKLFQLIK